MTNPRAFTLIEVLLVIGMLAILATITFATLIRMPAQAHKLRRISDLRTVQKALGEYAADHNGAYPPSATNGAYWNSQCGIATGYKGGNLAADNVIPGLVPTYLSQMPADPAMNTAQTINSVKGSCCYIYKSDTKNYKLLDFNCSVANYTDPQFKAMRMVDPCRPGPSMPSFAIGVWTPGAGVCNVQSPPNGW